MIKDNGNANPATLDNRIQFTPIKTDFTFLMNLRKFIYSNSSGTVPKYDRAIPVEHSIVIIKLQRVQLPVDNAGLLSRKKKYLLQQLVRAVITEFVK